MLRMILMAHFFYSYRQIMISVLYINVLLNTLLICYLLVGSDMEHEISG